MARTVQRFPEKAEGESVKVYGETRGANLCIGGVRTFISAGARMAAKKEGKWLIRGLECLYGALVS